MMLNSGWPGLVRNMQAICERGSLPGQVLAAVKIPAGLAGELVGDDEGLGCWRLT